MFLGLEGSLILFMITRGGKNDSASKMILNFFDGELIYRYTIHIFYAVILLMLCWLNQINVELNCEGTVQTTDDSYNVHKSLQIYVVVRKMNYFCNSFI